MLTKSGNILTKSGNPLREGNIGNGLKFDGVNDYVSIPHNAAFNFGTGSFCVSGWFYMFSVHVGVFYAKGDIVAPNKGFEVYVLSNGKIGIGLLNGGGQYCHAQTDFVVYAAGELFNFTLQRNGNIMEIFVNGVLVSNTVTFVGGLTNVNGADINNTEQSLIGIERISPLLYPINSIIYDLKIFNKALSQTEATKLYNGMGMTIPATALANLVANWGFNQKSGTTVLDSSINGFNGSATNFASTTIGAGNAWVDKNGNSITV